MAVLYGHIEAHPRRNDALPSENEMPSDQRIAVELKRLECLLDSAGTSYPSSESMPDVESLRSEIEKDTTESGRRVALGSFNVELNKAFACLGRNVQVGYQLGRSLRDTANPPAKPPEAASSDDDSKQNEEIAAQFARTRIATLQAWFRATAPDLPKDSAVVVSGSMGKWADFVEVALGLPRERRAPRSKGRARPRGRPKVTAGHLRSYLLRQGDVWINLLTGTESTDGLLSPEGYVMAAEAAVTRAARLVGRVLRHYWGAILAIAAALAAVLSLSAVYLPNGAGRTWTQILSILGSFGITTRGVGSTLGKLTQEGAKPVYAIEEQEVKAWAITSLPPATLGPIRIARLRHAGIGKSRQLGRS
ncbi:MAG TPA: hypothetical protein VKR22_10510 [Acidimicrobiales bacterium]|nr:hypothetical protein [Acidimicrobiales bacterium]